MINSVSDYFFITEYSSWLRNDVFRASRFQNFPGGPPIGSVLASALAIAIFTLNTLICEWLAECCHCRLCFYRSDCTERLLLCCHRKIITITYSSFSVSTKYTIIIAVCSVLGAIMLIAGCCWFCKVFCCSGENELGGGDFAAVPMTDTKQNC